MRAGVVVTAASAASSDQPRATALPTWVRNVFTSFKPLLVSANVTPALPSAPGLPGAACQWRSSSVRTSSAFASSATSGASGKLTGTINGRPVAATRAIRLYSSPAPTIVTATPASRAIFAACSTSSMSSATMTTGCCPLITGCRASHARFSDTRSLPARRAEAARASRYHLASRNACRSTAIAPINDDG